MPAPTVSLNHALAKDAAADQHPPLPRTPASGRDALRRRASSRATLLLLVLPVALGGCFGKHPGPWRAATPEDLRVLRDHYKVETADREVLRRDVSVWFIGPASGYPEWAFRNGDGTIEIVKEPRP